MKKHNKAELNVIEHLPQGGDTILYSVENNEGKRLIDNTGKLSQVYYGYSEEEALSFIDKLDTVIWY